LVLHGGDEIGVVNIDAQLLEHILSNLITNAIKYSAETSQVHVNLSRVGEDLVIEVIDQGIGIPAKDLENIGTPFYRASNTGSVSGTGLGFAIAARAAARHGGGLEIESELGRGTRVVMRMKISRGGGF
jgi:signal transduction histidine kinase